MRLDHVTAELRPRETWEASDFGARLVRRDASKIYFLWFAITLPMLALAILATWLTPYYTTIVIVYWWLEPIADGPILHIIARRLFGEDISRSEALRATGRIAWQNRLFLLTPFRLHAARSVAMPVTQLEGLTGAARRKRSAVINNHAFRHGMGLTIVYQHVVAAVYLGIVFLGYALIPEEYHDTLGSAWLSMYDTDAGPLSASLGLVFLYIAQSALQPWFVGAGFGLYINCRTRLEAWDLEVAFRRMKERRSQRTAHGGKLAAAIIIVITPFALQDPAVAQDEVAEDPGFAGFWTEEEVRPTLEATMSDPRLDTYRDVERWVSIDDEEETEITISSEPSPFWDFFRGLGKLIATLVEYSLWIGIGLLIIFLFVIRDRWLPYLKAGPKRQRKTRRVMLAGGEVTEESLPADIPAEVRRLWAEGRQREAMALMYRGSVFSAVRLYGVRLPTSATEGDCLKAVSGQTDEQQTVFFRRMLDAWLWCAYGARYPDDSVVELLCDEWLAHYGDEP